ncbi:hypothetical protein MNBD_GAMMA10-1347 [hydrothermal vent metagenome]|uniref:ABC transporter substrate-binding protein n=1 Tax=hydrothermal vent metagenome TaxID=652676 RepID=A0A3B0XAT8_9ZZZZ
MMFVSMLLISCTAETKKSASARQQGISAADSDVTKVPGDISGDISPDDEHRSIKSVQIKKTQDGKSAVPIPERKRVHVLLSSSSKSYQQLAMQLADARNVEVVEMTLSGDPAQDNATVKDIQASDVSQIVAIGLKAAQSVKSITDKQIIFAQVVNYRDYDLVTHNFKGVSALPSPEKLFKDWKALSPRLSKVVVVVGRNLHSYLAQATKAAKAQGIELIIKQVSSDKEFVYRSKNIQRDIQGQWILPDSRVLSSKALKEVMAYGSRRGRQIVVFSPKLLSFGGLFCVSPDIEAIAAGILLRLKQSERKAGIQGDGILPVMSHTMVINQNIAKQLNLIIPPDYRVYINGE